MNLLMISGDRSILDGKKGPFWYTLQELRAHWDRIDIICPPKNTPPQQIPDLPPPSSAAAQPTGAPGNVFFHPSPYQLWRQAEWILKRGTQLHAEHQYNVMTVHEYPPFYNGRGAHHLSKRTGIPVALEVHHIVGMPTPANMQERMGHFLSRFVLPSHAKFAEKVRTVNATVKDQLMQWGVPEGKLSVVPSFYLDHDLLTKNIRPPLSYDVSFCARLVPNKGLANVIRAIALLKDARLLVIGDGPDRNAMEKLVKSLGIANRVTFLGWLPTEESVIGAILTARMFVMNSTSEGGPRSALEAMGAGMPVIATKVGVMPDVIRDGENGMFTTGTPEDLSVKIQQLISNETQRTAMGEQAKGVLAQFERRQLVAEYAHFLQSIASSSPTP